MRLIGATLGMLVLAGTGAALLRPVPAAATAPAAAPELGPLVCGSLNLVAGSAVWTDYVYDDHGAASGSGSGGADGYPDKLSNAADLVQLQIAPQPAGVRIRAILQTLNDPRVPLLGVGFDTDANPATGAATVPGGRWQARGALGLDLFVSVRQGAATVLRWQSGAWQSAATIPATVDPATQVIETTLPPGLADPGRATWGAVGVVGVVDRAGHSWLDGGEPIFDLAYVGGESLQGSQDQRQAAILAGRLDAAQAVGRIDFGALRDRVTRVDAGLGPGYHTVLYHSALRLGGGIQADNLVVGGREVNVGPLYAGPYQPYLVRVPDRVVATPAPLLVFLHGLGGNHLDYAPEFGPGLLDPAAYTVFPLGRGPNGFYLDAGEQDVLDVTDDALARLPVDPARVILSGVSMGGFGTFRLGIEYPDRWAALLSFIGTAASPADELGFLPPELRRGAFSPTEFAAGRGEVIENLVDDPVRMINGQVDPIVANAFPTDDLVRLEQLGYDHSAWTLLRRQHEVVPQISDCVLSETLSHRRDPDPARVVYSIEPEAEVDNPATGLRLHYAGAFWVSGMAARPGAGRATVDALSQARADRARIATQILAAGENLSHGADLCGDHPGVQTMDAWRETGLRLDPGPAQPVANTVAVSLAGVSTARLDLTRAGLRTTDPRVPVVIDLNGDGVATLELVGDWRGLVRVSRDGGPGRIVAVQAGQVGLAGDLGGHHRYTVVALGAAGSAAAGGAAAIGGLPDTAGGAAGRAGAALPGAAIGLAAAAARRRRRARG